MERLRLIVAWVIVSLWVVLVVIQTLDPARPVPPIVSTLMMLLAGYLFAPAVRESFRRRQGGGEEDG